MASTFTKVIVHIIFRVKPKTTQVRSCDVNRLFEYIGGTIRELGGIPIQIGGTINHVHILTTLPKNGSLADFVRDIKTSSTKWLKTIDLHYYNMFCWQAGYGAFSVSPSLISKTQNI